MTGGSGNLKPLVSASLLSCDHGRLAAEAASMESAGADMIHLDVMDGVFVPELTFGPAAALSICRAVRIPVDGHLMVEIPDGQIEGFAKAGCRYVTVHAEPCPHLDRTLSRIRRRAAFAEWRSIRPRPLRPSDGFSRSSISCL